MNDKAQLYMGVVVVSKTGSEKNERRRLERRKT
jgi:hypothetical protein